MLAEEWVEAYREASERALLLWYTADALIVQRSIAKQEAIVRILPDTKPDGKPHSMSSAEAVVESDAAYLGVLQRQRDVGLELRRAERDTRVAELRAMLAIRLVAEVGAA